MVLSFLSLTWNSTKLYFYLQTGDSRDPSPPAQALLILAFVVAAQQAAKLATWILVAAYLKELSIVVFVLLVLTQGGIFLDQEFKLLGFCSSWITSYGSSANNTWNQFTVGGTNNRIKRRSACRRFLSVVLKAAAANLFVVFAGLATFLFSFYSKLKVSDFPPLSHCFRIEDLNILAPISSPCVFYNNSHQVVPSSSCLFHFRHDMTDVPLVRICDEGETRADVWKMFGVTIAALVVVSFFATIFLDWVQCGGNLYRCSRTLTAFFRKIGVSRDFSVVTSAAIKDLMTKKLLLELAEKKPVDKLDSLLKEMIEKANPEVLLEPGSSSGLTCLESALDKGFVHLWSLMKVKLQGQAVQADDKFSFTVIGKTAQRLASSLERSVDNPFTCTIRIRRAFRKGNLKDKGQAQEIPGATVLKEEVLTVVEDELEARVAVGLMRQLTIFFSNFDPESAEAAENSYRMFKSSILRNIQSYEAQPDALLRGESAALNPTVIS